MTFKKGYIPHNKGKRERRKIMFTFHIKLDKWHIKWLRDNKLELGKYVRKIIGKEIEKELLKDTYLRETLLSEIAKDTV
jgi:hypothetical protein